MTNDPVILAIVAFNELPNKRFRHPVGGYKTTYELVAYLEEVVRHSSEIRKELNNPRTLRTAGDAYLYHVPSY